MDWWNAIVQKNERIRIIIIKIIKWKSSLTRAKKSLKVYLILKGFNKFSRLRKIIMENIRKLIWK